MEILVSPDRTVRWQQRSARCALGRGGISTDKAEGDRATPAGRYPLREAFYRADKIDRPRTGLPVRAIAETDGWCDDPADPAYNRFVELPYPGRHERMWRADGLYDLVIVVGYNDDPPVPGRGSAIFVHAAAPGYAPTEGCVALERADLLALAADCKAGDWLVVTPD